MGEAPPKTGMRAWVRRLWPRRLISQVMLLTTALIVVAYLAMTVFTASRLVTQLYRSSEQRLGAIASNLAIASAPLLLVRDQANIDLLLLDAAQFPGVRQIAVIGPSGRMQSEVSHPPGRAPYATFNYRPVAPPQGTAPVYQWRNGGKSRAAPWASGPDARSLVVWQPIQAGRLGWVRIESAVDDVHALSVEQIELSALFALATMGLSGALLYVLLRPKLRALADATRFARDLTHIRGQQAPVTHATIELEQLDQALNETSLRLLAQESAIKDAQSLLAKVLEAASEVSIIATKPDGIITVFNRGAERLLDYRAEELIGKQTPALFHLASEVIARGEELSGLLGHPVAGFRAFVELPEQHGAEQREWTYVRKDGTHVPVSLVVTTMRNDAGEITGYLGIAQDIAERKSAEAALRDQAMHTQAILDNIVDGIIVIDQNGVIQSFNPAAEHIFGYAAQEIIGHKINRLMPSPHREAHDAYLRDYHETGVARIIGIGRDVEGQRKDGSVFPMELGISEVSHRGKRHYVGVVRDISERKRVERMKTEFVSTVSHELRTPLTSISGALGLVAGGMLGSLSADAQRMISIAHKNSQRLTFLINDLLDMEKLVAGKMHFDLQRQALQPLLEQAIEANRTYGAERGVGLVLRAPRTPLGVVVDSQRLLQILANLLSNAIKYSPEGAQVEVTLTSASGHARVAVADHGPGIPAAFRERIFQKFSQADSSDTRLKGGTGLGLAITRELVERMGGTIGFASEEGQGACFHFELALCEAQAAAPNVGAAMPSAPRAPRDAPRILVLEDEPDVALVLGNMLDNAGYVTDIAGTAAAAFEALRTTRYAAMTVDLMLPDMSGLTFIRQLRQSPETANLPLVVVSAKMEEGRLALSADLSGIEWLAKPIDQTALLAAVGRHVDDLGPPRRVLHVEDDRDFRELVFTALGSRFEVESSATLEDARSRVSLERFDVVLLELVMPDGSGWELLPLVRARQPHARVVILAGEALPSSLAQRVEAVCTKSNISASQLVAAIDACVGTADRAAVAGRAPG